MSKDCHFLFSFGNAANLACHACTWKNRRQKWILFVYKLANHCGRRLNVKYSFKCVENCLKILMMRAKNMQKSAIESPEEKRDGLSLWAYNQLLIFFCLVGLGLSLYAYSVELMMEENKSYKPMCDISPQMSCTKAFGSP